MGGVRMGAALRRTARLVGSVTAPNAVAQPAHAATGDAQPSAAIVDSQSVKAAETVGADSRGFDAGKKINGRKRHAAVDVEGFLLSVVVTAANAGDRTSAATAHR
jgi:Transposase DDE domain